MQDFRKIYIHFIGYRCKNERCHAKLIMRVVDPDPEGNTFGLYGCSSHQHPLTRNNKSEIIFRNFRFDVSVSHAVWAQV